MGKRIALTFGFVLVFGLALTVFASWVIPRLASTESSIPDPLGLFAFAVVVSLTMLTVFPRGEIDYIDRFINRVVPLPSEEQGG